jgi:ribosomal protein S18 acetylase RimI-like enzyme
MSKLSFDIRPANPADAEAIMLALASGEGYTELTPPTDVAAFLQTPKYYGLVAFQAHPKGVNYLGVLLFRYRNRFTESAQNLEDPGIFNELSPELFSESGDFCEVFDLWVHPSFRRQGIASQLKKKMVAQILQEHIFTVYTHTESRHEHIIRWNQSLGYQIVREGPIWDETPRTSLMLSLERVKT